jgi:predicted dehydrogenase
VKQVVQEGRSGLVKVQDVPAPAVPRGGVLVRTVASVVSPGTERDMLAFARKSLLSKAIERPDLVRQVVDRARRNGIAETFGAVMSRLDTPTVLGYSAAGVVLLVGSGVDDLSPGDGVACAGAGYASHAEVIAVPRKLCVRIPNRAAGEPLSFEEAAFATLGAIALQGVRLTQPTLGERVVVIGLGMIGQLACQLLRAHGCEVFAVDRDPARVTLACELGAQGSSSPYAGDRDAILDFTHGVGADAVVVAAATPSSGPVELAGAISRRKGRVVVVGNVGMHIPRREYYERELSLTVSSSYGPGRYDPSYEERGIDYPIGYVRWTAQRNMEAVLGRIAAGFVQVSPLISHRFPVDQAERAFALIGEAPPEPSLGIVLNFAADEAASARRHTVAIRRMSAAGATGVIGVGVIGAGSFARGTMFPRLRRMAGTRLRAVAASTGVSASSAARQFGFELATTAVEDVIDDAAVNAVFVLTRHSLHARQTLLALRGGKHVFVEKPICVSRDELHEIASVYRAELTSGSAPVLTVGFNRRFSPLSARVREAVVGRGPLLISYRVNAGALPAGHWLRDPEEGGRIVGEACHFIDLAAYLTGARPRRVFATRGAAGAEPTILTVDYSDGSVLDLTYVQDGPRGLPKERIEVFARTRSWLVDDWHELTAFDGRDARRFGGRKQQKGHDQELEAFLTAIQAGGSLPIPFESLLATTMTTFCALESVRLGTPVEVPDV